MTHTPKQLAAFSAVSDADREVIRSAIWPDSLKGASQVLADGIGSENPATAEIDESNESDTPTLAEVSASVLETSGPATRMAEEAVKAVKINPAKVNPELLVMFENLASRAVAEKITASKAVQLVMLAYPAALRVAIKHTAALVGINPLSARNTFDKFSKAAK